MIDVPAVLTAAAVCAVGVMSPGPNFVAVTHRAVSAPRAEALSLVAGIASISGMWAAAAVLGIGVLFALFPWMFWTLKLLGAAYLVWLGIQLLRHAGAPLPEHAAAPSRAPLARAFRTGMVTNLSNPKAMIFYASVFSASVPAGASPGTLAAMIVVVPFIAAAWYGSVAVFLSGAPVARLFRKARPAIERSCGALLLAFGLRQALSR